MPESSQHQSAETPWLGQLNTPITGNCQESHSESSNSHPISIGGVDGGQSIPTGVGVTSYEDQRLGTRRCPAGVSRWLVIPIVKKAQAQLMCWPTDYRHLVSQRVRQAAERNGQTRGSGDKGINLVNIQSEE